MNNSLCNICLEDKKIVVNINEIDDDQVTYCSKLNNLVPELNWHSSYCICSNCLKNLRIAYNFKSQCVILDTQRNKLNNKNLDESLLICYKCAASFSCKQSLENHITSTHFPNIDEKRNVNETFKCEKCGKLYKHSKVHRKHVENCDGVKRIATEAKFLKTKTLFTCETCNESFSSVSLLKKHCAAVHSLNSSSLRPFSCDICGKRFSFSANLKRHRDYHNNVRKHVCTICGKAFVTSRDLTCHEFIHNNERSFKCESCDKAFKTYKNLNTHQRIVHNDPSLWKYCCNYCQKRFPMKSNYDLHVRRHENDKRHACDICSKTFVTKSEMRIHVRLHSNIREFKCEYCNKEYKNKYVFQVHLAKIHGVGDVKIPIREKKYACHICPTTFYDKSKLNRHLCSHTGIKPFPCSQCDKKFTDKWNLRQHLKLTHNIMD